MSGEKDKTWYFANSFENGKVKIHKGRRQKTYFENQLALNIDFGPDVLRAPPVVADESEAGHCFHSLFTHFGETPKAEVLFPLIFWHN